MNKPLINIGKVVSVHGLKGEIKVFPYSDFPERCYHLKYVRLTESEDINVLEVENVRIQGVLWVIKLKGVDSRNEADKLRGRYLYILPEERMDLPPDTYYFDDIIGLEVYSVNGEYLGIIKDILPSGGQDAYVVGNDKKFFMIPAVKKIIREVDTERGRLTADLPEGLLDL